MEDFDPYILQIICKELSYEDSINLGSTNKNLNKFYIPIFIENIKILDTQLPLINPKYYPNIRKLTIQLEWSIRKEYYIFNNNVNFCDLVNLNEISIPNFYDKRLDFNNNKNLKEINLSTNYPYYEEIVKKYGNIVKINIEESYWDNIWQLRSFVNAVSGVGSFRYPNK